MNESDKEAVGNVIAETVDNVSKKVELKIKRKLPEWVVLLATNLAITGGTAIITAIQSDQIHLGQWSVAAVTVLLSIIRMFNKTHQDVTLIKSSSIEEK